MKTAFLMSCVLLACYCSARPIDIDACIVGDPNSVGGAFNETVISDSLVEVNRIFRQAAMSFRLRSCMYTNDAFLAEKRLAFVASACWISFSWEPSSAK